MVVVFLADGFEEIEALSTVDVLRRAGLPVVTVGVGSRTITGAHQIAVVADQSDGEWAGAPHEDLEAVVLPGGMPGTRHLEESAVVDGAVGEAVRRGAWVCAICAAPSILGRKGLLDGRRAVCFPGFEQELRGARVGGEAVAVDGRFITARGAGVAVDFALEIVSRLKNSELAARIGASMQCR